MQFGDFTIRCVSGGNLWLDGGAMFGPVPRVVWERYRKPDDRNRVQLATNCLLIESPGARVLVDSGYGATATDRERDACALEDGNSILDNLKQLGLDATDIDIVILTHLHFDHVHGCTIWDRDELKPTFPGARHYVQRFEWEDAVAAIPELRGAYSPDHLHPLMNADLVELVDGSSEILPGISVRLTGGHTRGHQIVRIASDANSIVYLADTCPFITHLRIQWTMAYDQFPLEVRRVKRKLFEQIVNDRSLAVFQHDPDTVAAFLTRDDKGDFRVDSTLDL